MISEYQNVEMCSNNVFVKQWKTTATTATHWISKSVHEEYTNGKMGEMFLMKDKITLETFQMDKYFFPLYILANTV